jgi:hypothetical protein
MANQVFYHRADFRSDIFQLAARFNTRDFLQDHFVGFAVSFICLLKTIAISASSATPAQNTTAIALTALSG